MSNILIDKKSTPTVIVVEIIITFMTEHDFCSYINDRYVLCFFFLLCVIGEHELPHKTTKIIIICKYTDLITYSILTISIQVP